MEKDFMSDQDFLEFLQNIAKHTCMHDSLQINTYEDFIPVCKTCGKEPSKQYYEYYQKALDTCKNRPQDISLDEALLREGMLDSIRALVPKGETPRELARQIIKILGSDKYGVSIRDTFVDVFSTIGESLEKALARLVDYGIKAQLIKRKLPESFNEEYDDTVSNYFTDLIDLQEGRYDLTPVKCTSQESKKSYWSPYDKKEREFAEYGTRFRYDTRKGCQDAINDPDKDLGYNIDGKKKYKNKNSNTSEDKSEEKGKKMEEKLILDETQFSKDLEPKKGEVIFNGEKFEKKDLSPTILKMVGSPLKKNGEPKMEAWLLIKLYENTINAGRMYIAREDLLNECGVANSSRQGQSSTYFNTFKKLGLAYLRNNKVYPGTNLEDWFKGNSHLYLVDGPNAGDEYGEGVDLSSYLGKGTLAKKEEQGGNPNKSHRGRQTKKLNKELTPEFSPEYTPEFEGERKVVSLADLLGMNESLDTTISESVADKFKKRRAAKVQAAYRKEKGLEEDAEITPQDYNDYIFKNMCSRNGWDPIKSKKVLFGKF